MSELVIKKNRQDFCFEQRAVISASQPVCGLKLAAFPGTLKSIIYNCVYDLRKANSEQRAAISTWQPPCSRLAA